MLTLNDWKKMPPDHMTEYRGRRMKVKEVVKFLEGEYKRAAALKQIRVTPAK
jgi:hypothetical protein